MKQTKTHYEVLPQWKNECEEEEMRQEENIGWKENFDRLQMECIKCNNKMNKKTELSERMKEEKQRQSKINTQRKKQEQYIEKEKSQKQNP